MDTIISRGRVDVGMGRAREVPWVRERGATCAPARAVASAVTRTSTSMLGGRQRRRRGAVDAGSGAQGARALDIALQRSDVDGIDTASHVMAAQGTGRHRALGGALYS